MESMFGIIYRATNKINGKIYVGQTTRSFEERKSQHISDALCNKYNMYFHRAIRKYGVDNFDWDVLDYCETYDELNNAEIKAIEKYNAFGNGYNLTKGGKGSVGFRHSEEFKERMSNARIGVKVTDETKKKISLIHSGKRLCEATKKKISDAHKGITHSEESRQKISKVRVELGLAKGENNPMYGKRHTKETKEKISKSCSGRNHRCYGKHLSSITRSKISKAQIGSNSKKARRYIVITPIGERIFVHGIVDFCRNYKEEKLHYTLLIRVAQCKQNHHKGYRCEYLEE